jgi:uncharacterized protein (DUF2384 family)
MPSDIIDYWMVRERAIEVLGSAGQAEEWMNSESRTLGGKPAQLARTEEGARKVLLHLHGVELSQPE